MPSCAPTSVDAMWKSHFIFAVWKSGADLNPFPFNYLIWFDHLSNQVCDGAVQILQAFARSQFDFSLLRPLWGPCVIVLVVAWRDFACLLNCSKHSFLVFSSRYSLETPLGQDCCSVPHEASEAGFWCIHACGTLSQVTMMRPYIPASCIHCFHTSTSSSLLECGGVTNFTVCVSSGRSLAYPATVSEICKRGAQVSPDSNCHLYKGM